MRIIDMLRFVRKGLSLRTAYKITQYTRVDRVILVCMVILIISIIISNAVEVVIATSEVTQTLTEERSELAGRLTKMELLIVSCLNNKAFVVDGVAILCSTVSTGVKM
jgi:hypothetical protein